MTESTGKSIGKYRESKRLKRLHSRAFLYNNTHTHTQIKASYKHKLNINLSFKLFHDLRVRDRIPTHLFDQISRTNAEQNNSSRGVRYESFLSRKL